MDDAVSSAGLHSRLQTSPEIREKKRGAADGPGSPVERRPRTRTWPIFSFALAALLALMLVPALTALRRSEEIYTEVRASQEQFQASQRLFDTLSQNVLSLSIAIRELLLDSSPDAGRVYRSRIGNLRTQLRANIDRLAQTLPADANAPLAELQQQVDAYLAAVSPVFDWTPDQRLRRGVYFLREEQRPRRETILAVAEKLSELNAASYAAQQRRTTESEQWFRSELRQSVAFALLTGLVISAAGIFRMRSLERRASEQRRQAEVTSEEMRSLSVRLRHAQEEERRTISRELHDEVGQALTALRMELGTLQRRRLEDQEAFEASLAEAKGLAERSVRTIRDIAAGLRPSVLDDLGLGAAVQKQAREFEQRTGIDVQVSVEGEFDQLGDRVKIYVYRIVQEALTNCAKHARATEATIRLVERDGAIVLAVSDNGIGFERHAMGQAGLGLIGIEERVRELRGAMTLRSAAGQGTTIQIQIPHQTNASDSDSDR